MAQQVKKSAHGATKFWGLAVGSIHDRLEYWERELEADQYAMTILREGFRATFVHPLPAAYEEPNNKSARDNWSFGIRNVKAFGWT